MQFDKLIEEFRLRYGGLEDARAKALISDMRAAGIEEGERLKTAFDNLRARWKFKYAPTAAQFRDFYPEPVEAARPRAYHPGWERMSVRHGEISRAWRGHMLTLYGHPDACRVRVNGMEMTAWLHPLNRWMSDLSGWADKRIDRAVFIELAHEDGRAGKDDVAEAKRALLPTMAVIERCKAVDAKWAAGGSMTSPFVVEELSAEQPTEG